MQNKNTGKIQWIILLVFCLGIFCACINAEQLDLDCANEKQENSTLNNDQQFEQNYEQRNLQTDPYAGYKNYYNGEIRWAIQFSDDYDDIVNNIYQVPPQGKAREYYVRLINITMKAVTDHLEVIYGYEENIGYQQTQMYGGFYSCSELHTYRGIAYFVARQLMAIRSDPENHMKDIDLIIYYQHHNLQSGVQFTVSGCYSQGILTRFENSIQRYIIATLSVDENYQQLWTDADYEDNEKFDQNLQKMFGEFLTVLNPTRGDAIRVSFVMRPEYFFPYSTPYYSLNNQDISQTVQDFVATYNFEEQLYNVTQSTPNSHHILLSSDLVNFARDFFGVADLPGIPFEGQLTNPIFFNYSILRIIKQTVLYANDGKNNFLFKEFQKAWVYNDPSANQKSDINYRTELVRPTEFYWKFILTGKYYRMKQGATMEPLKWPSRFVKDRDFFFGNDRSKFTQYFGQNDTQCTYFHDAIGQKRDQVGVKSYDNMILPIISRTCSNAANFGADNLDNDLQLGNEFGENNKCFQSNVIQTNSGAASQYGDYRCHTYRCNGQNSVNIYIQDKFYPCQNGVCEISGYGYEGTVILPQDVQGLCKDWPRVCPKYCSQQGYCENDQCHCLDGRAGTGCQLVCSGLVVDGVCTQLTTCPEGMISYPYSRSCETPYVFEYACQEYMEEGACVATCSPGFYTNEQEKTCERCDSKCATCQNASECLTCASGYIQGGNVCKTCEEWVQNCSTCQDFNTCTTCSNGYYLNDQNTCTLCDPKCSTCSSATECLSCANQEDLIDNLGNCQTCQEYLGNQCLSCSDYQTCNQCTDGYYLENGKCLECVSPCQNCDSESNCLSCVAGEFREDASQNCVCQSGYTENSGICSACQYPCGTCTDPESCLTCINEEGRGPAPSCLCQNGYFDNESICQVCSHPCQNCISQTECLSCAAGENRLGVENNCACQPGFTDISGECLACEYPCNKCNGSVSTCTECANLENRGNAPSCACLDQFFENGSECQACVSPCKKCSSETSCLSCQAGFLLGGDQCKECSEWVQNCTACSDFQTCITCDAGYYLENGQCVQCVSPCKNCTGAQTCTSCEPGFIYSSGQCKICEEWISDCSSCVTASQCDTCDAGFYLNDSQNCTQCSVQCATCESATKCSTCASGYYSNYSDADYSNLISCVSTCEDGKFKDETQQQCSNCDSQCQTCSGPDSTDCETCFVGTYLHQSECVSSCPNMYYNSTEDNTCQECDSSCSVLGCTDAGAENCKICPEIDSSLPYFYNGGCVAQCPDGTYVSEIDGYTCEECYLACGTCTGASDTDCTSCVSPFTENGIIVTYYFIEELNQCVNNCLQAGYPYQNEEELICENCQGCLTCLNEIDFCTSCENGTFLHENSCISTCPAKFFGKTEINQCVACKTECKTCSSEDICLSCEVGYYYFPDQHKCLSYVPSGTYLDINSEIQYCNSICSECENGQTCTSCNNGLALYEGNCLTACPTKTFLNTINMECLNCREQCQECENNNTDYCSECALDFYQHYDSENKLTCLSTCPSTYYPEDTYSNGVLVSQQCIKCSSSIAHCDLCENAQTCISCKIETNTEYFLTPSKQSCVLASQCGTGFYPNTQDFTCSPCNAACQSCTGGQISNCQSCNENYFLANQSVCTQECPDGFYEDLTYRICQACESNCRTCEGGPAICTGCEGNSYLLGNECVQECGNGLWENSEGNLCSLCDETCLTCTGGDSNQCVECVEDRFYFSGYCLDDCGVGRYADTNTHQCQDCPSSCETCTSYTYCTDCNYPYTLQDGNCVNSWCKNDNSNSIWCRSDCTENCDKCYGTFSDNCLTCDSGFYLYDGSCLETCPDSTFIDAETQTCMSCSTNCAQCDDFQTCNGCVTEYFLNQSTNKCVLICPSGTYNDVSTGKCEVCSSDCKNCSNIPNKCTSCNEGTYLSGNTCVTECGVGQFEGAGECVNCSSQCVECDINADNCTVCPSGTFLLASTTEFNHCLTTCPSGYYQDSTQNVCHSCQAGCLDCHAETGYCQSCSSGYLLILGECQPGCLDGYYLDQSNSTPVCKVCPATCSTCESAEDCYTCATGYVLVNGFCKLKCDDGTYRDETTLLCEDCDQNCAQCTSQSCQECTNWTYLFQGNCVWNCPYSHSVYAVQVGETGNYCQTCDVSCQYCYSGGSDSCDKCSNGYFRVQGSNSCVQQCPSGFYGVTSGGFNNYCAQCKSDCLTCEDKSDRCTSCPDNSYLYDKECVKSKKCPSNTYADSQTNTCKNCDSSCKTCDGSDQKSCLSCYNNKYLVNGECVDSCPQGKYYDSSKEECKSCSSNCETCRYKKDYCTSCPSDSYLVKNKHECSSTAPQGYFISDNELKKCSEICKTCESSAENCTSCKSDFALENNTCICEEGTFLSYSCRGEKPQCLSYCPNGYFKDNNNRVCEECTEGCARCDEQGCQSCGKFMQLSQDQQSCQCNDGMFMYQGSCYWWCPNGYWADTVENKCQVCSEGCAGCGSDENCWQCQSGYVIHQGKCVEYDNCPQGFWAGQWSYSCKECSEECSDCENSYSCTVCADGLFMNSANTCVASCENGFFGNTTTNTCDRCSSNCQNCSDESTCTQCGNGYFLNDGVCLNSCPVGTWKNTIGKTCENCQIGCSDCSSESVCQVCESGYALINNSCFSVCANNQYRDSNLECQDCNLTCGSCFENAQNCLTCIDGYVLNLDKTCKEQCSSGSYLVAENTQTQTKSYCSECDINCSTCFGKSNTQCYSCNTNYVQFGDNTCLSQCPAGYANVSGNCQACTSQCLTCSDQNNDTKTCTSCQTGLYLYKSECQSSCPSKTFVNGKICQDCHENCQSCSGSGQYSCNTCVQGYYYIQSMNACVNDCPTGYFENDAQGVCTSCPSSCKLCTGTNSCQSCREGYFMSNGICLATCPDGQFGNSNTNQCEECNSICSTCFGQAQTQCYTCTEGYQLTGSICTIGCPNRYFLNSSEQCENCSENCQNCESSAENCISCEYELYLYQNTCYNYCPDQTYANANEGECVDCPTNCLICQESGCISCATGYGTTANGQCAELDCGEAEYAASNTCENCISNCKQCNDGNSCEECYLGYLIHENTCKDQNTEIPGFYPDTELGSFQPCAQNCATCTSQYICTSCESGLEIYNDQCTVECSTGFFRNSEGQCQNCEASCKSCYGEKNTQCEDCSAGYYLHLNSQCVSECPQGFYSVQNQELEWVCLECGENCLGCEEQADNCLSCQGDFYMLENTCYEECPQGYFGNQVNRECQLCDDKCATCYGVGDDKCYTCAGDFYLQGSNQCVETCLQGFFADSGSQVCKQCDLQDCKTCSGSADNCLSCATGKYFHNNFCMEICPSGFYENDSTGLCTPCNENCRECSGPNLSQCTSCLGDYFYQESKDKCVQECENGTYPVNNVCADCQIGCKQCTDLDSCLECTSNYYLINGECLTQCPEKYYQDPTSQTCIQCAQNCATCSQSASKCTSCESGLYFMESTNTCLSKCDERYTSNDEENICEKCDKGCLECEQTNQCTKCEYPYVLSNKKCTYRCDEGFRFKKSSNSCEPCAENCSFCFGSESNQCSSCADNYYLYENKCYSDCPSGFFGHVYPIHHIQFHLDIANSVCLPCDSGCSECEGSPNFCTQCENGMTLNSSNQCVSECLSGSYRNQNGKCKQCHNACVECFGPSKKNCLQCSEGFYLQGTECRKNCSEQHYLDQDTQTCQACSSPCKTCTEYEVCQSCDKGFVLQENRNVCLIECDQGYYKDQQICAQCPSNCGACQNETFCTICSEGFYLYDNECIPDCPTNYFKKEIPYRECMECYQEHCEQCNKNTCVSCKAGYEILGDKCLCVAGTYAFNGICIKTAPEGFYLNDETRTVEECHENCSACNGPDEDQCTDCILGLYFNSETGLCGDSCQEGFYQGVSFCRVCSQRCETCTDGYTCDTCKPGLFLVENQCYYICPVEYYNNGEKCASCSDVGCLTCNESEQCLSCENDMYLYNYTCITLEQAEQLEGVVIIGGEVLACDSACTSCENSTSYCLSCVEGYYLQGNSCVSACGNGYYLENPQTDSECSLCHSSCKTCYGQENTQCNSCQSDFGLIGNTCTQDCGENKYVQNGKCVSCSAGCETCEDSQCLTCKSGYIMLDSACQKCSSQCATCEEQLGNCTTCAQNYFMDQQNNCVQNCESGFYKNSETRACETCASNCQTCSGPENDQCITCAEHFINAPSCVPSKPNCKVGKYVKTNYNENQEITSYSCEECAEGCSSCISAQVCTQCDKDYYLDKDTQMCTLLPAHKEGKYVYYTNCGWKSKSCPRECEDCGLTDVYNRDTLICYSCESGYQLGSDGACTGDKCGNGQYDISFWGRTYCYDCPSGCSSCSYQGFFSVECSACEDNYVLRNGSCVKSCADNEYLSESGKCKSCHYTCDSCSGAGSGECETCISGYEYKDGKCSKKDQQVNTCTGGDSYYNYWMKRCSCFNIFKVYTQEQGCISWSQYLKSYKCGQGSYFNIFTGKCGTCSCSNKDSNKLLCKTCEGGNSSDCSECIQGYYLQTSNYSCQKCSNNCKSCSDYDKCDSCESGTYKVVQDESVSCQSFGCPAGYVVDENSLYALNSDIVKQGDTSYTVKNGVPTYKGKLVTLECVVCTENCDSCISGLVYDQSSKTCSLPDSNFIEFKSENAKGYQNENENLILRSASDSSSYKWTLTKLQNKKGKEINLKNKYVENFFGSADTNSKTLIIPAANLKADRIYTLKLTLGNGQSDQIDVKVEENDGSICDLSQLGISQEMINIFPLSGLAGETEFTVSFNFNSYFTKLLKGWVFTISVENTNLSYSFENLSDEVSFEMPGNLENGYYAIIITASKGNYKYVLSRSVQISKNNDYDCKKHYNNKRNKRRWLSDEVEVNSAIQQLLTESELLSILASTNSFSYGIIEYIKGEITGLISEMSELNFSNSQLQSIALTVQNLVDSQSLNQDSLSNLISIANKLADVVENNENIEIYLQTVQKLIRAISDGKVSDLSLAQKSQNLSYLRQLVQISVNKWAQMFNYIGAMGIFDNEKIKIMVQTLDTSLKSEITSNLESSNGKSTQVQIDSEAFSGNEQVTLISMIADSDYFGDSDLIYGDHIEIKILDALMNEIEVKDLQNKIQFVLATTAELDLSGLPINSSELQDIRCAYYDTNENRYKIDGVNTLKADISSAVKCESSHLTQFSVMDYLAQDLVIKPRIYVGGEDNEDEAAGELLRNMSALVLLLLVFLM